ncbi:alpha/beta fold hydrolase [Streptomyces mirabilis]|jgi:pimeloyl-ACP methyl ester carboxylesterase|uniref:Pimeloyl-ACP methyl ester carboxylesterase n=1 Tax=Streptomyces mirabilis TaxID=68239 RepID=A0A1I2HNH6_9ACTN|nr:alpha/beta hydrolase [Streptomyces mirabilis]SFF31242.1 Pimeloyl-ACP methyl ester carboxylesterase [Streptomyces mirabilis]
MNSPISRRTVTASLLASAAVMATPGAAFSATSTVENQRADPRQHPAKPTIVLIHGAFADASSWSAVVERLLRQGHHVLAPALPLRGLASDASYIRSVLDSIQGPIVLVGHSYGGSVISQAAAEFPRVKALVYIAAFVPDIGESALELTNKYPGSTLAQATSSQSYPLPSGGTGEELIIKKDLFREQFAAGVPIPTAQVMAAGQRPITVAALQEKATAASWKKIPSWYLVATEDRNIPPAAEQWMAERAGARTITVRAPHAVAVSHPGPVTDLILSAARRTH